MRQSRQGRRTAATLYILLGLGFLVVGWASATVVLLVPGIGFLPLAAWALRSYPIDDDW
jgi:hypothetical protein